jgi:hypothetical protein
MYLVIECYRREGPDGQTSRYRTHNAIVTMDELQEYWLINPDNLDEVVVTALMPEPEAEALTLTERGLAFLENQDVLTVRAILHAHQRSMTPPDSGWGNMSYLKGSYDHTDTFKAALAAYKQIQSELKS